MQPKNQATLETIHEILRDALNTTTTGARMLGAISCADLTNGQLAEALKEVREKFKPVLQGMKRAELAADCLELVTEKVEERELQGGLFEQEPAGNFVDAPVALEASAAAAALPAQADGPCPRCKQPFEHQQPAAWLNDPFGGARFKVHESCMTGADVRAGYTPDGGFSQNPAASPEKSPRRPAGNSRTKISIVRRPLLRRRRRMRAISAASARAASAPSPGSPRCTSIPALSSTTSASCPVTRWPA